MRQFIPVAEPSLVGNEQTYVADCIATGWISSLGKYVIALEEQFAQYCGVRYALTVSNGTTALHLALATLGIGPGDEVLVPTLTFVATANAVTYTGARPVLVDSEPETWNIDPQRIEECITLRTKAIMPVHLYGHPVDMGPVMALAQKHGLKVVEDAAEAHGAEYKGKKVGTIGDVGCFSLYGNKIITSGEGGMLTTDSLEVAERAKKLRDHAMSTEKRYWHDEVGFNYRMTNLQAAVGLAQLERIEEMVAAKRRNAAIYDSYLSKVAGITLPVEKRWAKNVYWMYSILIGDSFRMSRDAVMAQLKEKGIDSRPFFYPMHQLPMYKSDEGFPVADELARKGINLPSGVSITEEEVAYICRAIAELSV